SQEFRSPVIYNTVNPKWNYICEAVVHHLHDQNVEIEVMDEDQGSKDDFLGRTYLSLKTISMEGMGESWLRLKDITTGAIHLRTTWFSLSDSMQTLNESIEESKAIKTKYPSHDSADKVDGEAQPIGSVAAILVYLDGAHNLAVISKTAGEPDPYCLITIDKQKRQSIVQRSTANPIWEESFTFLVDNLNQELEITFDIIDSKTNRDLGTAKAKLQHIISCDNLSFSQPLPIKGRGSNSELNVNIIIRILKSQKPEQMPSVVVEDTIEESEESRVPTLEDMIKGTVQPIIDTSGALKGNFMEKSQTDRKHNHVKTNGFQLDPKWRGIEIVIYSRTTSTNLFKKKSKIIGITNIELTQTFADNFQAMREWYDLEQLKD
ncbi:unnamed protein product, partial [Medioppia subpectinata]